MKQHIFCILITIIGLTLFGQDQPIVLFTRRKIYFR